MVDLTVNEVAVRLRRSEERIVRPERLIVGSEVSLAGPEDSDVVAGISVGVSVGTENGTSGPEIDGTRRSELEGLASEIGASSLFAGGAAGVTIGCAGTDASVEVAELRT